MRPPCAARAPARRAKRAPYGGGRCIYGRGRSLTADVGIHLQQPQPLSHRGALAAVHITPSARVACTALTREVGFSFLLSFLWASILILAVVVCCSSVFTDRVEDGVGPDRPSIKVVGVVDQVFH